MVIKVGGVWQRTLGNMLVPVDGGVVNGADAARVVRGREVLPAEVGDGRADVTTVGMGVWGGGRGRGGGKGIEGAGVKFNASATTFINVMKYHL